MSKLLTPKEVAELLQVSLATVYRKIAKGEIKTLPMSGDIRIYPEQFEMDREKEERLRRIWAR